MDEKERGFVWACIGGLAALSMIHIIKTIQIQKQMDRMGDVLVAHFDIHEQEVFDEQFVDIVNNLDEDGS